MGLTADFSGAIKKLNGALCIPKASKFQAQRWLADTRKELQRSAADMKKSVSYGHKKTAQLQRNIGQSIVKTGTGWTFAVGTGLGGAQSVIYANVQDKGGTIRPKGHPFLTIPMPGVTGKARDYKDSFLAVSADGQWMIARSTGKTKRGLQVLFLLRKKVDLPPTRWFSGVIDRREPILEEMMDPEVIYNIASQMRGGKG